VGIVSEHMNALRPHEVGRGVISVGRYASHTPINLPYIVVRGARTSPCLWVNGAVHGNESQAAYTGIEFARGLNPADLEGTVVVTPIANPPAFDARRKYSPIDELDLDQSFPGRPTNFSTELLAERLFEEIRSTASVLINLHTMGPFLDAIPYAVYKITQDAAIPEAELLRIASLFDPYVACRMDLTGHGELPGELAGALDFQILRLGRPALMIELGAGGRLDLDQVAQGVRGLVRLARSAGVLNGPPDDGGGMLTRVTRRTHLTCSEGGFFRALVRPGAELPAGSVLGQVVDAYGDLVEEVRLSSDVLIIGVRRDPVVHTGDRVGFVGLEWDRVELPLISTRIG
jgi:predicted deacylase